MILDMDIDRFFYDKDRRKMSGERISNVHLNEQTSEAEAIKI